MCECLCCLDLAAPFAEVPAQAVQECRLRLQEAPSKDAFEECTRRT